MKNDKKQIKMWKKVLSVILVILAIIALALGIVYLYADNKVDIRTGYNEQIETGGEIESTYLQFGNFNVKKITKKAEAPIKKYTIYYPEIIEQDNKKYPLILMVNGTGGKASKYEPQFELFASWGFIIIGNQDKGTGTGETTIKTLQYMLAENDNPNSIFYQKIDIDNIGITGFSQGGAAVFNAITKYEESTLFKAAAPLSPVSEAMTALATDYTYDSFKVKCPILIFTGTEGDFETKTVIPFELLKQQYDKITAPKVMARRIGMDHDHMMYSAGGYVIAWFRWQLMNDQKAAGAFVGDNPELLTNKMYQDQRITLGE